MRRGRKGDRARHRDRTRRAAGIQMGDPALLGGNPPEAPAIGTEETDLAGSHAAAVPGVGRGGSRPGPMHPGRESKCRRPGAPAGPDFMALAKQSSQAFGKCRWVPASSLLEAEQEFPGELSIIRVLAEGKLRVRTLLCPAGSKPILHVRSSHVRGLGFDNKPECVAECLTQERSGKLIFRYPDTGSTSRPQCLHTRARARIRSAQ
jgi:hypothetical protein